MKQVIYLKKIRRTKEIEGTTVPGIINNGGYYFYINVDVYEDGMTNCWELVDLRGLQAKINSNWLTASVPNGENLSIHALGVYKIQAADWKFNKRNYYRYILNTIKSLNPQMDNIYRITGRQKQLSEQRRISHSPRAADFYVVEEMFYQTMVGNGFSIFMKYDEKNYLVNLVVYKNGSIVCYFLKNAIRFELEEISELFHNGTFFTSFDEPTKIIISDLHATRLCKITVREINPRRSLELFLDFRRSGMRSSHTRCIFFPALRASASSHALAHLS